MIETWQKKDKTNIIILKKYHKERGCRFSYEAYY